jgi:flagellar FliL protein
MADNEEKLDDTKSPAKKPGMMALVKAGVILSVVVVVEMVAASVLIPSAKETASIGEKLANAELNQQETRPDTEGPAESPETDPTADTLEVDLGSYHVLTYEPESGISLNIDFELWGTVLAEEESTFHQLFTVNEHRIKEQVIITMRGTELTDLTAAELGLIKRRILEKTNRALGKPLLREVLFPKFSFLER